MPSYPLRLFFFVLQCVLLEAGAATRLTILHTNDLHSHVQGTGPDAYFTAKRDGDPVRGGFSRLVHFLKTERARREAAGEAVVVVDAGDFMSGTLFHALAPSSHARFAPEIEFFKAAGYDAVTLGNHEFDAGEKGIETVFQKASQLKFLDHILASNLEPNDHTWNQQLTRTRVLNVKSDGRPIRVGLIGVMGPDAARVSSSHRQNYHFIGYRDEKQSADTKQLRRHVEHLAEKLVERDGCDIVVLLAHAGHPEDEALAVSRHVKVVIAGHTHQAYAKPKKGKRAWIGQSGQFGESVGVLALEKTGNHWELRNDESKLIAMDDTIASDAEYSDRTEHYVRAINETLPKGFSFENPSVKLSEKEIKGRGNFSPWGTEVTSLLRREINREMTAAPIDVYFTTLSLVRTELPIPLKPTVLQFSDLFRVFGLLSETSAFGAPVVHFYLKPKEFLTVMEFLEAYRHISANFTPTYSDSLKFEIRNWGIPLVNRIQSPKLYGKDVVRRGGLVHIATSATVASFMDKVPKMSYGIVNLRPRDAHGEVIDRPYEIVGTTEAFTFASAFARHLAETTLP